jgi:hypothetical protein
MPVCVSNVQGYKTLLHRYPQNDRSLLQGFVQDFLNKFAS